MISKQMNLLDYLEVEDKEMSHEETKQHDHVAESGVPNKYIPPVFIDVVRLNIEEQMRIIRMNIEHEIEKNGKCEVMTIKKN